MGFSRQDYWSGLPFPSPGDLPDPGTGPRSPALQADALTSEPPGKPFSQWNTIQQLKWINDWGIKCKWNLNYELKKSYKKDYIIWFLRCLSEVARVNSGWVQKGVIIKWQHTFDIDRYIHYLDSADSSTGVYVHVCEVASVMSDSAIL